MTLRLLFLLFAIYNLFLASCTSNKPLEIFPHTEIELNTLENIASVRHLINDSIYTVEEYWLDVNGKDYLYKLSHQPYKKGRLHGTKVVWNKYGDTLELSHWEDGIPQDSAVHRYERYPWQVKELTHFTKVGSKKMEISYHPNGMKKMDTIYYQNGKREGPIRFYDDKGKQTETYYFREDKLEGVDLYRDLYTRQENLSARLIAAQQASFFDALTIDSSGIVIDSTKVPDSTTIKQKIPSLTPNKGKSVIKLNETVNETYKGNTKETDAVIW